MIETQATAVTFDNEKYLAEQTASILERAERFHDRLYLEFGGKLTFDYHAARVLTEEFGLPPAEWPVYLANVFLIGLVWGLMRLRSGSVIGPALSHAVWNALVYGLLSFLGVLAVARYLEKGL